MCVELFFVCCTFLFVRWTFFIRVKIFKRKDLSDVTIIQMIPGNLSPCINWECKQDLSILRTAKVD